MTTIEGLGKKFQDARLARGLTLDEAARMTKIRPSRLAEIEGDDFSQFPSLAYAKGFLLIYGKFLDVDVTPYMEAFEGSDAGVTVDGYSYLQDNPAPAPIRAPIVRRRPARVRAPAAPSGERTSLMPLIFGVVVIVVGFLAMKLILNLQRLAPKHIGEPQVAEASPSVMPTVAASAAPSVAPIVAASATAVPRATVMPPPAQVAATVAATVPPSTPPIVPAPTAVPSATAIVAASPPLPSAPPKPLTTPSLIPKPAATAAAVAKAEPEVRKAEPVKPEDLAAAGVEPTAKPVAQATAPAKPAASATPKPGSAIAPTPKPVASIAAKPTASAAAVVATTATTVAAAPSPAPAAGGPNHIVIKSLKKTYVRVVVDDEASTSAYERWLAPGEQTVEFNGKHINIKVLERDAIQIKKNGKTVSGAGDDDVTIE